MSEISRLMYIFFKLLYHQFAPFYDIVAAMVSFGRWKKWSLAIQNKVLPGTILELGPGPGHLLTHFISKGYDIIGLDESPQMLHLARKNAIRVQKIKPGSILLCRGLAQRLPFPDNHFHTILSTFPTPYIFDILTIQEITRVLKPGGEILVLLSVRFAGKSLLDRFLAWLYRITGEDWPASSGYMSNLIKPYENSGILPTLEWLELEKDRLLILHGVKSNEGC